MFCYLCGMVAACRLLAALDDRDVVAKASAAREAQAAAQQNIAVA